MLVAPEDQVQRERVAFYRYFLRQRPAMLALLTALAVLFFLTVTGLSKAYHEQRESLGNRWFGRGVGDLAAKRYDAAVTDFRAALLYAPDDYAYQLNLAEALIGMKRTGQAAAYLLNLWDRQPQDGLVNLELARIATQRGQTSEAIRYYNDAVYAVWPADQEINRREARLELIELLLGTSAKAQAQAELVALAANKNNDPALQQQIGDLFLRADDPERALDAYRATLKAEPHNGAALAGAGNAAFQLGRYAPAQHYLQAAVAADPKDAKSADRLATTEMVLSMDPFRRQISVAERNRLVVEAFVTAGQRFKNCAPHNPATLSVQAGLSDEWSIMRPKVSERALLRDPDLVEPAMDLVFQIERQASTACSQPTGSDLALLLISKLHEGNQ